MTADPRTRLPRIDRLLDRAGDLVAAYGRGRALAALRAQVDRARDQIARGGAVPDEAALLAAAAAELAARTPAGPRRVINAAGVVVHTNLGRAPLAPAAVEAMVQAAGACDLEIDLATGRRGSRGAHVDPLVTALTGAEDAMVVNNCAAALVLVLAALAAGREVPVSRGELVEIGGSFRLPEIMAASGARLLEVGTTNRTRAEDYRAGDDVALLLKVHRSNFAVEGFTQEASVRELAAVAADRGVPLVHDVGSGLPDRRPEPALAAEPSLAASLRDGADLVLASGDKLLGGPQAGIVAGRADLVAACRRHPLARALRVDKLRLAALRATLDGHLRGEDPPVLAALHVPDLDRRAARLAAAVGGEVVRGRTMIGGGSAPGAGVDSPVVALPHPRPDRVAGTLRRLDPPLLVRVADDRVLVDLRTVHPADDDRVAAHLLAALGEPGA